MRKMQHVSTFMSLSSSPSDGHEGSHGINVEELGACLQESLAEVDALRKRNDDLEKEKTKVERKNDRLKDAHQSLFQTNAQLQRQNKNAEKENEVLRNRGDDLTRRLEERKEDHRKEIAQLKSQIYDITRTRDLFRQMIVPVSEKQVPDFDVISKFGNLRSSIHELLRQTWTTELKEDVDFRQLSPIQQDFFGSKLPLSYDRLRSLVFRIIEPTVLRSRNYFLGKGFEEFEQRIRDVDEFLHQNMSKGKSEIPHKFDNSLWTFMLTCEQENVDESWSGAMRPSKRQMGSETMAAALLLLMDMSGTFLILCRRRTQRRSRMEERNWRPSVTMQSSSA